MPPITILDYESDGEGGWLIEWHDEANLDGQPLTGYFHLTLESVAELFKAREATFAPRAKFQSAIQHAFSDRANSPAKPPSGRLPSAVQDWLDGYNEHVDDCIDRVKLNVDGAAPHHVLENARLGNNPEKRWQRNPDKDKPLEEFMKKHGIATVEEEDDV